MAAAPVMTVYRSDGDLAKKNYGIMEEIKDKSINDLSECTK